MEFVDVPADVFEQAHFKNDFEPFTDYTIFIQYTLKPNEVAFFLIKQQMQDPDPTEDAPAATATKAMNDSDQGTSLSIQGFSPEGQVIFKYENQAQQVSQSFGVGLRYYKPHLEVQYTDESYEDIDEKFLDPIQKISKTKGEGAYVLRPEWENGFNQYSYQYSSLDTNVVYQQGKNLDQYTIVFNNATLQQQGVVTVRFSPKYFQELIEFEVELNGIPLSKNGRGKDLTVNWQFFDGFDPRGVFWTDSNELAMVERHLYTRDSYLYDESHSNISSNYYPVDSAIAMRDQNGSNLQVTIMNDRAQGGSADLSQKASIELMQNRRTTEDDNKGVIEPLNETDRDGVGLKTTAKYYMQIFDFVSAKSKQRTQQILID